MNWLSTVWLLAAGDEKPAAPGGGEFMMFAPFVAIAIIFYFLLIRPQRREQASRETMLSALKKNDKVLTIGGIIGSVANISPDGQEVTLKVDDNTRVKFIRSSIQRVMSAEGEVEKPTETK
jgi:preprotein translocase subunit YajC